MGFKPFSRTRQRGVAVVTALLLTTLAVTIVASLFWQQQVQVRSIENQRLQLQKQWILRGALDWARLILRENARLSQIRIAGEWPQLGNRNFDCPQGDLALVCQESVFATPNPAFRRVEVSVVNAGDPERRIIKLTQVVPNGL